MKTYKEVYQFPLRLAKYGSWVYDEKAISYFSLKLKTKKNANFY